VTITYLYILFLYVKNQSVIDLVTLLFLVGVMGSRWSLLMLTTFSDSCMNTEHIPPWEGEGRERIYIEERGERERG